MKRSTGWHISGWPAVLLTPIAILAALLAAPFARTRSTDRTPGEVAGYIRDFIEGTGGEWDWDDFISVPIADPALDAIRLGAGAVPLPVTSEGLNQLRQLLARAKALI